MRRKSTRNAQKPTPEKTAKEPETPPKTRRSRRRKRSPSKSSDSEEELVTVSKRAPAPAETPDTTTKSHTPTDEETPEESVWKVTSSEEATRGEVQKLKICLKRPCPDSPDKSRSRRSKSNSQTEDDATSSEDKSSRRTRSRGSPVVRNDGLSSQEGDEDVEEKKGKGKSKGKHKSKIEKSPHLSEPEIQTNNEISENVQVTPQSPSIDNPVDNENDYNKVDVDDIQNVNESVQRQENVEESACNVTRNSDSEQDNSDINKTVADSQVDKLNKESDDDRPLIDVQKIPSEDQQVDTVQESSVDNEPPVNIEAQSPVASEDQPSITSEDQTITSKDQPLVSSEQQEIIHDEVIQTSKPQPQNTEEMEVDKNEELENKHETQEVIEDRSNDQIAKPSCSRETEAEVPQEEFPEKIVAPEDKTKIEHQDVPESVTRDEATESTSSKDTEVKQTDDVCQNTETQVSAKENSKDAVSPPASVIEKSRHERTPRRRLKRDNECIKKDQEDNNDKTCHIKPSKSQRKWESGTNLTPSLIKLDLESIQGVWPTIDFPEEPDLKLHIEKERRRSSATEATGKKVERKVSVEYKSDISERPSFEKQTSVSSATQDSEDNSNIIAFNRKISIVEDTASKLKPPPSPAKNPTSNILFITNLVRPFTVKQLKELLERTGNIQEEGFWTDRIKSKCYVQYKTEEEAEATRNALHGVQWPIGNGKKLIIDYATVEDLNNAKNPPAPPPVVPPVDVKASTKENVEPTEAKPRPEEKTFKEIEKKRPEGPVREWDIGKKEFHRDRSRSRERNRKHRRSPSPPEDFITRKQRKAEESVPQKLMDDLFLKTKATPSIYWQPLSPEEISMKQQQRLIRMEEHKRRMEENSRMKGREMGRGAFRRRYD